MPFSFDKLKRTNIVTLFPWNFERTQNLLNSRKKLAHTKEL